MSTKRTQVLEDVGTVRSGERIIENVPYRVEVFAEYQEGRTSDGPYRMELKGRIEGRIQADSSTLFELFLA